MARLFSLVISSSISLVLTNFLEWLWSIEALKKGELGKKSFIKSGLSLFHAMFTYIFHFFGYTFGVHLLQLNYTGRGLNDVMTR